MALLEKKNGIVTGAGQGIGRAIALSYAREGAQVVVADINEKTGRETVDLIENAGGTAAFSLTDVSDEASVRSMVDFALTRFGRLDIACNCAALSRGTGLVHGYERSVFDETIEMCLTNTWLCMKYEIISMLKSGGGSIVNISSNSSLRGRAHHTAYANAKGGVNILTKSSAAEYGAQGIRINAVLPGVIRTPGLEKYSLEQPNIVASMKNAAVMNRIGEPEEIAEAVSFLSSDRASFITGQLLSVDGGGALR